MKDYSSIIDIYMNFWFCRLVEYVDDNHQRDYFEDIYSYAKISKREIKNCLYELHMPDIKCSSKNDIVKFYDSMIGELRVKLRKLINDIAGKEFKKVVYLLVAYQAEFHARITITSDGGTVDTSNAQPLEKLAIELAKDADYIYWIKYICAIDKNAIQLMLQESFMISEAKEDKDISLEKIIKIYGCAQVIINLISIRWLIAAGIYKEPILIVKDEELILEGDYYFDVDKFQDELKRDITDYEKNYPKNVYKILDANFYKIYGFKLQTVEDIVKNNPFFLPDNTLLVETDYITLINEFAYTSKCTYEEAQRIFEFFCIDDSKIINNLTLPPEKDENRIFEKCILKVDEDKFLYSRIVMMCSYDVLMRKLQFNLIKSCKKLNSQLIEKKIKKKFELEIASLVGEMFPKVISNVHKLDAKRCLTNEVDVMFMSGNVLYVVECKDVSFQYTPYGFMVNLSDERKYIAKIHEKIDSVTNYIDYFEDYYKKKIDEVQGILVYRTTNIVTEMMSEDEQIYITSFEQFRKVLTSLKRTV